MKRCVGAFVLGFLSIAPGVDASEPMKAIVASYLEIQTALAADKLDGVKDAARAIGEQSAKLASGAQMSKAAKTVESAKDLKTARDAFGALSDAVIAAAKAEGWQDISGVKVGFCPMVNRSWVQKEGTVANPYYGKSMLTCGTLSDPDK